MATLCPGITTGDVISLILNNNIIIDSIVAPVTSTFKGCKIGVRDVGNDGYTLKILDATHASGSAGNTFRTPGQPHGGVATDYVVNPADDNFLAGSEEGWTEIFYTSISTSWRILDRRSVLSAGGGGGGGGISRFDLTHSPVALYHFNDNLNDSSGNGFHFDSGTPTFQEIQPNLVGLGAHGGIIQKLGSVPALAILGAITIECLGVVTATGAFSVASYAGSGETEATNILWQLDSVSGIDLRNFWEFGPGNNSGTGSMFTVNHVLPRLHTPCLLGITRATNGVSRAFVNGVQFGATSTVLVMPTGGTSANLQIGATSNLMIFGLKIIAAELTPAQMAAEYNRTLGAAFGFLA